MICHSVAGSKPDWAAGEPRDGLQVGLLVPQPRQKRNAIVQGGYGWAEMRSAISHPQMWGSLYQRFWVKITSIFRVDFFSLSLYDRAKLNVTRGRRC
jgi:hypothetical protein